MPLPPPSNEPPAKPRRGRLEALQSWTVKELRSRLRELQHQIARHAAEEAEAEVGDPRARRGNAGRNAPCLVGNPHAAAAAAAASAAAAEAKSEMPIEKGELAIAVEAHERRVESWSELAALCGQALAEATTMCERVGELEQMARHGEWESVVEHARWLADDYPQHRALRSLQLDGFVHLGRLSEADHLLETQSLATPDAPELLYGAARLVYIRSGPEAAVASVREIDMGDTARHGRAADLAGRLRALLALRDAAKEALLANDFAAAIEASCGAISLAEESAATGASLTLLLGRALSRAGRHVECLAACDGGLRLCAEARMLAGGGGATTALPSSKAAATAAAAAAQVAALGGTTPPDQERLLLLRGRSFMELGQPAQAIGDFRSAAQLNPNGSQAAAGLKEAWRLLQSAAKRASLYEVRGVKGARYAPRRMGGMPCPGQAMMTDSRPPERLTRCRALQSMPLAGTRRGPVGCEHR